MRFDLTSYLENVKESYLRYSNVKKNLMQLHLHLAWSHCVHRVGTGINFKRSVKSDQVNSKQSQSIKVFNLILVFSRLQLLSRPLPCVWQQCLYLVHQQPTPSRLFMQKSSFTGSWGDLQWIQADVCSWHALGGMEAEVCQERLIHDLWFETSILWYKNAST